MARELKAGRRRVEIGHPDKVLFPDDGVTKLDLAEYYLEMAEVMLPHLRDRPISMLRFPDGIEGDRFYQKKVPDHFPDWVGRTTVSLRGEGGSQEQVVVQDAATLVYLADQACITPHPWLSRRDRLERPDRMIFDLDPPPGRDTFAAVREGARALRRTLADLELESFVQTTGSRGLHVVVPLQRRYGFDEVRAFARDVAELLVRRRPDAFTVEQRKDKRGDRLFVDFLRNAYGQTAVPPYAVRARPRAPVATPVEWDELGGGLNARSYTIANVLRRLGQRRDPWRDLARRAQALGDARDRLDAMLSEAGAEDGSSG